MARPALALLALLAALALAACAPSPPVGPEDGLAADYFERGHHRVGYTVLEQARADAAPLVVKAWYPAVADTDVDPDIAYPVVLDMEGFPEGTVEILGAAHLDAPPDVEATYPLVVLSHGFGMNPEWYHPLAEHLASQGFVVLGPEHRESSWIDHVLAATATRPGEVSDTIDLAESGVLEGIVDTENIAVVGHSYGGYTALAAAGARFDPPRLAERCVDVSDPFIDDYFCKPFVGQEQTLADHLGLEAVPEGLWPSLGDDRVDAIIPMAGDAYLFGEEGLASVTLPTMLLGGTGDTGTPWDWGAGLAYENISSEERTLVAFEGAQHFIQVTTCDRLPWITEIPLPYQVFFCQDFAWDKKQALAHINQLTTAFLMHTLVGEPDAKTVLDPAMREPVDGLTVSVQWD